jgi:predicted Ser/Thr protein kinase
MNQKNPINDDHGSASAGDTWMVEHAQRQVRAAGEGQNKSSGSLSSAACEPAFSTPPPDSFTGYRIVREIHRGGQGVVYQAIHASTHRKVAIKVMKEGLFAGPSDRARFDREVHLLGQLNHRNIVAIHDTGSAAGCFYFVMDYVAGQPLDVYVAGSERSIEETLELFAKICDAVNAAHLRGIIHRDLKPGNIRIDAEGEPHILDFGLAKSSASATDASLVTVTGEFVGSMPWASPEQAECVPGKVDVRTDVYSLGVILFQMLTGKFPYDVSGNIRGVLDRIISVEPIRPSSLRQAINNEVDTMVLKCLCKERERRYQSAGELARDVRRYLNGEPIEAKRDSAGYVLRKILSRYKIPTTLAAVFLLTGSVLGATMTVLYQDAKEAAHGAQRELAAAKSESKLLREQFDELFRLLQENRVNFSEDPLPLVVRKHEAIMEGLEKHKHESVRHFMAPELVGANYVLFRNATSPRLSGNVVRVGPQRDIVDLASAQEHLRPGDLVLLDEGAYTLPPTRSNEPSHWTDIAIVGAGQDKTTLAGVIESAERLRVEGVRVECRDNEFVDMRGGTLHLRDCYITGYNSGAGGSNAIYGNETVMLVERCTFEGKTGRASGSHSGDAFDLRGFNLLYVRQSHFLDNGEIIRATFPCVFEECTGGNSSDQYGIIPYSSGFVLFRGRQTPLRIRRSVNALVRGNVAAFSLATDDIKFLGLVLGEPMDVDAYTRRVAQELGLEHSLPYWIGLLRHEDSQVRNKAAGRVASLTGLTVSMPETAEAASTLRSASGALFDAEREYARVMAWYEENHSSLRWNDATDSYELNK